MPRDSTSHRALASGHHLVHNAKCACVEQMAWRNRVTAALPCTADSCVKPRKPFHDDHPIAHAPVILSSSDHSKVPRSPKTMECDCQKHVIVKSQKQGRTSFFVVGRLARRIFSKSSSLIVMQSPPTNDPETPWISNQTSTLLAELPDALAATEEVHPALAGEYPSPSCKRSSC